MKKSLNKVLKTFTAEEFMKKACDHGCESFVSFRQSVALIEDVLSELVILTSQKETYCELQIIEEMLLKKLNEVRNTKKLLTHEMLEKDMQLNPNFKEFMKTAKISFTQSIPPDKISRMN